MPQPRPLILIVEDSLTQAIALEGLLMARGYGCAIAENGAVALEMAERLAPSLIVSDITMPVMSGFALCAKIKSHPVLSRIPILLLTDLTNPDDIIHGLEARADGYITKPYEEGFLLDRVAHLLERGPATFADDPQEASLAFPFHGEVHQISASRRQILEMLISTYEHSLAQKRRLEAKQEELNRINAQLEASLDSLRMSEERFRSLVETIPDIVYRLDEEGCFLFLNSAVERLGYQREDLVGRHFTALVHDDEAGQLSWNARVMRGKGESGGPAPKLFDERRSGERMTTGLEVRLRTASGGAPAGNAAEINSSGLYTDDKRRRYAGTVGVIRDITDRKRAQEALRRERAFLERLIDTVPLPLFFVDQEGVVRRTNAALLGFFDLSPESVRARKWIEILGADAAARLTAGDETGEAQLNYEAILPVQGEERRVQIIKLKLEDDGTGIGGQIGVILDVTERIRTENSLREAKRLADEATKAKSDFLANMSHELRTPLNAILGFSEMITLQSEEGHDLARIQGYAGNIHESGAHLLSIINDILDISAVEAGRLNIHPEMVEVSGLVVAAERLVQMRAAKKGLALEMDLAGAPERIQTDSRRLKQILVNLLANAVKFTPEGGRIGVRVNTAPDGGAVFAVWDEGIGMDEEGIAKAMTLFGQVDSRLSRRYEGTGLGLPLSRNLAEVLGGRLDILSRIGQGTTVTVTLPPEVPFN